MRTALTLITAVVLLGSTTARAHVAEGSIPLTVAEAAPGVTPPANAGGTADLELSADLTIEYTVTVHDLTGPVFLGHIHEGAPGVEGGIVFPLTKIDDTTLQGETEVLTEAQVETLLAGGYYVNVHTTANGGGEVRGQIVGLDLTQGTCSCRTLSRKDFRKCVAGEIKKLDKTAKKSAEVKALKKAVKKSACGLAAQPKKKPLACCLPINEAANTAVSGKLCAPVKKDTQCAALGGAIVEGSCVPDNPCFPPASPSGAFLD